MLWFKWILQSAILYFRKIDRESRNVETMSKYRNEQLNRVLMSRRSVVFKDRKHPTRQKLKQQLKKEKDAGL